MGGSPAGRLTTAPILRRAGPVPTPARRFTASDLLLPASLVVWLIALRGTRIDAIDDWGLFAALPVLFYLALALLVGSIAMALTAAQPSSLRLGAHVVALVLMLHGTVPLLFPQANYPWVYKHVGVAGYIDAHGALDPSVDIYQNWPGFFAVAAWFTRIAGADSPLEFAKWAPVYFNLLFCLELAFVLWALPLSRRARWLAVFLFVAANWVGQDYFAPQALAFVLCLAAYGIVLRWLRPGRRLSALRSAEGLVRRLLRAPPPSSSPAAEHVVAARPPAFVLGALFLIFSVVVVTHQLSPFLVLFGVGLLTAAGLVRPRWVVVALAALALGYLALHLGFLRSEGHLQGNPFNPREVLGALSNPFDNAHTVGFKTPDPQAGRRITALASPLLILGLWVLAAFGAARRFRAGRPTLVLAILAAAPAVVILGQNYGGEAIFRIYLFSLPWTVALAASALGPRRDDGQTWSRRRVVLVAAALAAVTALFMSAFYGSLELYRVRPGAVAASAYFFDHARPGSVIGLVSSNVPARLGANYDQFTRGATPPPLSTLEEFLHHPLGPGDLPTLSGLYRDHDGSTPGDLYLWLSDDQQVYVEVLGLMPAGALAGLDRALASSPEWQPFFRNADSVIYRFVPTDGHPAA
ncbi:MAG: hypothetical protein ACRD12_01885 [Acidimicrobiales bacterium]